MSLLLGVIVSILSFGLVKVFKIIDKEVDIDIRFIDIIKSLLFSEFISVCGYLRFGICFEYILILVCAIYLIVNAHTDKRIGMVYTILSIIYFVGIVITVLVNSERFVNHITYSEFSLAALVALILIVGITSLIGGIGLGDSLIYINIVITYSLICVSGSAMAFVVFMVSNIFFVLDNIRVFVVDISKRLPLVPYILGAYMLTLLIV